MIVVEAFGLSFIFIALYGVMYSWLRRHGGVTRWRMWPVYIVLFTLFGVGVGLLAQPFDLQVFVVLVVGMTIIGVITGPFFPLPRAGRRAQLGHDTVHHGTSVPGHHDGASGK